MSVLEDLYNGKIRPLEDIFPENAEFRYLEREIGSERKYFEEKLSDGDKERFEKMNEMIFKCELMSDYASFLYGFRLGAMLVFEIFAERGYSDK